MPLHHRIAHFRAFASAIALSALLLAGCGQKGPLYLPEEADDTPPAESSEEGTEEESPEQPAGDDTQGD